MEAKKFFLDQHGCAKNQVDGEILVTRLLNKGLLQTFDAQEADLIIVNSCGFIQSAKEESLNSVLEARQEYPNAKIVLAGCLAERYADQFKKDLYHLGNTPLPYYIQREAEEDDAERYQTIFASKEGAVVAPAAGLHFSRELMRRMEIRDID
ncbi:MAG: S-adenosylmethionine:tRNA ribosyltransferase-isomerase, partial [Treponema sp.]|nr:S-adenosylmethionine:tRNA ribosyltransferase-isomerase [Treponema sp.]